jgi:hypothetical protein
MVGGTSVVYTDGVPRAEAEPVGEQLITIQHVPRDRRLSSSIHANLRRDLSLAEKSIDVLAPSVRSY